MAVFPALLRGQLQIAQSRLDQCIGVDQTNGERTSVWCAYGAGRGSTAAGCGTAGLRSAQRRRKMVVVCDSAEGSGYVWRCHAVQDPDPGSLRNLAGI